jgi:hypothetical protein
VTGGGGYDGVCGRIIHLILEERVENDYIAVMGLCGLGNGVDFPSDVCHDSGDPIWLSVGRLLQAMRMLTWVPRRESSRRHRHGDGDDLRDGGNRLDDGLEVRERSRVCVLRVW